MRSADLVAFWKSWGASFRDGDEIHGCVDHFGSPDLETRVLSEGAALADGGNATLLWIRGSDRVEFLNGQCTGNVRDVADGLAITAVLTSAKGRVIDLVTIFGPPDRLGLVTSLGRAQEWAELLSKKVVMEDCMLDCAPNEWVHLRLLGPGASEAANTALGVEVPTGTGCFASHHQGELHAVTSQGPSGTSVELFFPTDRLAATGESLFRAGVKAVGQFAVEVARIESGLPALGREMGEHTNPLESGLLHAVSFQKGCYVGQEVVARLHNYQKVKRQLCGLRFPATADPDQLREVFWDLLRVGEVTSATRSERLGATIALALLKTEYSAPGTPIYSVHESERIEGEVCALPF